MQVCASVWESECYFVGERERESERERGRRQSEFMRKEMIRWRNKQKMLNRQTLFSNSHPSLDFVIPPKIGGGANIFDTFQYI